MPNLYINIVSESQIQANSLKAVHFKGGVYNLLLIQVSFSDGL